jgi:hypothetical protein
MLVPFAILSISGCPEYHSSIRGFVGDWIILSPFFTGVDIDDQAIWQQTIHIIVMIKRFDNIIMYIILGFTLALFNFVISNFLNNTHLMPSATFKNEQK